MKGFGLVPLLLKHTTPAPRLSLIVVMTIRVFAEILVKLFYSPSDIQLPSNTGRSTALQSKLGIGSFVRIVRRNSSRDSGLSTFGCRTKYVFGRRLSGRAPLPFGDRPKRLESCQSLTGFGAHNIYACQGFPVLTEALLWRVALRFCVSFTESGFEDEAMATAHQLISSWRREKREKLR